MTVFEESRVWPLELSGEQVAYYRAALKTHANDQKTHVCSICGVASCQDFRAAYDRLADAGLPMVEPESLVTPRSPRVPW